MKKSKRNEKKQRMFYPEEQQVRNTLSLICKLVPDFTVPVNLEAEIFEPLRTVDWYTRRQAFTLWDIYIVLLEQLTANSFKAAAFFLTNQDEDMALDYWGSVIDRLLNDIYVVFTQSSLDSFLERYRYQTGKTTYGSQ